MRKLPNETNNTKPPQFYMYTSFLLKLPGIFGLLIITYAIFAKKERKQDYLFAIGGAGLLVYSIYIKDLIFIILQIVFISASLYELSSLKKDNR